MTENKEMNVKRFPDCDCSEDCLPEQGTGKNYKNVVTYILIKDSDCCSGAGRTGSRSG